MSSGEFEKRAAKCVASNGLAEDDPILKGMSKKKRRLFFDDVAEWVEISSRPEESSNEALDGLLTSLIKQKQSEGKMTAIVGGFVVVVRNIRQNATGFGDCHYSMDVCTRNTSSNIGPGRRILMSSDGRFRVAVTSNRMHTGPDSKGVKALFATVRTDNTHHIYQP